MHRPQRPLVGAGGRCPSPTALAPKNSGGGGGGGQWRQQQQQQGQQQLRTIAAAVQQQQQVEELCPAGSAEVLELRGAPSSTALGWEAQQQHSTDMPAAGSSRNAAAAAEPEAPPGAAAAATERVSSGGALSLRSGTTEQKVPRTLSQAWATFLSHPSPLIILAGLSGLLYCRAQAPLHPATDAAVAAAVAVGWCLQEWVVHAALLHSKFDWLGRRIHVGHHQRPYFHVSIDDPPIVLAFMAASLALFWAAFRGSEVALTAAIAYYSMGLIYEFTHYIVHTRYMPRSRLGKAIRMHHLLHHTRNEGFWLAFTVPQVDRLFGTLPERPGAVRMSDMARQSLKSARGA